jgi:hypothetical protein
MVGSCVVRLFRYQEQDSTQTLREGLDEFYTAHRSAVSMPCDLRAASASIFVGHDISHVIFGLTPSLVDEAITDARIMLATDVGLRRYWHAFTTDPHAIANFERIGAASVAAGAVLALPRIWRAMREAWHIDKRWPWAPPESFHARALGDLRREFRIRVI